MSRKWRRSLAYVGLITLVVGLMPLQMKASDMKNFWPIIDQSIVEAKGDPDQQIASLHMILSRLDTKEVSEFIQSYEIAHANAYSWNLWAAAYVINGGASDDGFAYFRDWLISKGEGIYTKALADPETLVGIAPAYESEFEEFRYVAVEVFERKNAKFPEYNFDPSGDPSGTSWKEADVYAMYPKLTEYIR